MSSVAEGFLSDGLSYNDADRAANTWWALSPTPPERNRNRSPTWHTRSSEHSMKATTTTETGSMQSRTTQFRSYVQPWPIQ